MICSRDRHEIYLAGREEPCPPPSFARTLPRAQEVHTTRRDGTCLSTAKRTRGAIWWESPPNTHRDGEHSAARFLRNDSACVLENDESVVLCAESRGLL